MVCNPLLVGRSGRHAFLLGRYANLVIGISASPLYGVDRDARCNGSPFSSMPRPACFTYPQE
ncbi:hypothetical protein XAC3810_410007 [Xanthomonas citri pv. citri]|uniref:Uncharacterized protein n=1 Tax=Xanthomonas citri pv. citri TaxID=611301 RepID=A0A0U5FE84_XANCI|nr:hypothetical protein XAC9322_430007 [Xanthomonas citri pv. citri]CEE28361.1 hypothetical protein XAC1083_430007 [Xanthomonas citri pv. citri]CEE37448.1 hypothetical protein XAC3810_410007 [Xanthomonas citri pv. citri]CEE40294.1 hypothetical protein XAC2911_400007 [Xanthomonas citri pv. citri]CEE43382.1 hypothetical protein XAC908_590007 [Xanthomonas citri pv. citri]